MCITASWEHRFKGAVHKSKSKYFCLLTVVHPDCFHLSRGIVLLFNIKRRGSACDPQKRILKSAQQKQALKLEMFAGLTQVSQLTDTVRLIYTPNLLSKVQSFADLLNLSRCRTRQPWSQKAKIIKSRWTRKSSG